MFGKRSNKIIFDPKNGLLDPKSLGKESKQHKNQAKFDQFCFQRFGSRFGCAEGAAPLKLFSPFLHLFAPF